MSQEWDYYYCYSCRQWFKKNFNNQKVFLPVRSQTEIKHLTWFYTMQMKSLYESKQLSERFEGIRRFFENYISPRSHSSV